MSPSDSSDSSLASSLAAAAGAAAVSAAAAGAATANADGSARKALTCEGEGCHYFSVNAKLHFQVQASCVNTKNDKSCLKNVKNHTLSARGKE